MLLTNCLEIKGLDTRFTSKQLRYWLPKFTFLHNKPLNTSMESVPNTRGQCGTTVCEMSRLYLGKIFSVHRFTAIIDSPVYNEYQNNTCK